MERRGDEGIEEVGWGEGGGEGALELGAGVGCSRKGKLWVWG